MAWNNLIAFYKREGKKGYHGSIKREDLKNLVWKTNQKGELVAYVSLYKTDEDKKADNPSWPDYKVSYAVDDGPQNETPKPKPKSKPDNMSGFLDDIPF